MKTNKRLRIEEKDVANKWQEKNLYTPSLDSSKPFYNLMMFPYPSAEGLHVGNMYAFTGTDVYGRYKRMQGFDVFEPIGLDGFGIHSENYAIKVGRHPKEHAKISQENFYKQLSIIGNGFSWSHRLETYDPEYYKWTQWLFIKLFKAGLAYKSTASVNWCPVDKTVLSDEQVEDGKCERCKSEVERRQMSSWFFKITDYADSLLQNLDTINWPEKIKIAQRQWIGKKEGMIISYPIDNSKNTIDVFTTRPDTNFGATFVVVSPEFAKKNLLESIRDPKIKVNVSEYIKNALNKSEQQRKIEEKDKSGVFTGIYATNRLNDYKLPVWVADYVLEGVGTGAVVGVPGHDVRDFEFAQKHNIEVKRVISDGENTQDINSIDDVFEEDGVLINSDFLNGLSVSEAIEKISDYIEEKGWGRKSTTYHLRDWGISRQRYWGPPIPMIYCQKCADNQKGERSDLPGWYSEKAANLPIVLPDIDKFKPVGDGTSPLSNASAKWKNVPCPSCGEVAQRELDVSDAFLDSSWYFLAYPHLHSASYKQKPANENDTPFSKTILENWFPVDTYIGGAEHAVLHLLYARFIWKVLSDINVLPKSLGSEPFPFLFSHGLIIKDGAKMSKSKGNVINPDDYIEKYGADAFRAYLMFLGPFDGGGDFRNSGIEGMNRFLNKVWKLAYSKDFKIPQSKSKTIKIKLHQTIKKVTNDIESFKYNTALAAIMELVNTFYELHDEASTENMSQVEYQDTILIIAQLLAPFAPFMTETIWQDINKSDTSIHISTWPKFKEDMTKDENIDIAVQVNGKLRAMITMAAEDANNQSKVVAEAKKNENVTKWIDGKTIRKEIFVEGKILNLIV